MEIGSVAENEAEFESSRRLFLRCDRTQEQLNEGSSDVGMDTFWEDQWPSSLKEWGNLNVQSCDSPLTSNSSSSLSTRDSSFFSWSEGSYSAAKHILHSPEPLSGRFSGLSLFNSGVNHLECACREGFLSEVPAKRDVKQDGYSLHKADVLHRLVEPGQSECDGIVGDSRPEFERDVFTKSSGVEDRLDGGWGSDTSDSSSRASALSEESQRRDSFNEADDAHLTRLHSQRRHPALTGLSHPHDSEDGVCSNAHPFKETILNGGSVLKCESCFLDKNDGKCACACSINACAPSSVMIVENSHVAALRQPSKASHLPEECHGGYGLQEGRGGSVRADRIARLPCSLRDHLLSIRNTVAVDREPFLHRKASYSAAVNETSVSSTMHGYLRFAEQGGSPCYSFFLDDSDEVLFARASRQERKSNKENCEWTYSFHSKKDIAKARGAWKSWPKKENLVSDVVANMRVSGLRQSKAKNDQDGRAKEARFVLYDGGGQQVETPRAGSSIKIRGQQPLKPVVNNISTPQAGQIKEGTKLGISNPEAKACATKLTTPRPNVSVNESIGSEPAKEELKPIHSQQAELAAIIITTSMKEKKLSKKKESLVAPKDPTGWGIKFLEKGTQSGWGLSFMERSTSNQTSLGEVASHRVPDRHGPPDCCMGHVSKGAGCGSPQVRPNDDKHILSSSSCPDLAHKLAKKMNMRKNRLKVGMTVILPAGDHGLPDISEVEAGAEPNPLGPTPLLERWASGGDCDCGGWDMGCGLSVFKAETLTLYRTPNIALTRNDRMNWLSPGNPFKLFTQGYRCKKVMVLEIIEAGLFSLSFQARVSPLQAFAIAVALFHQQMTSN